MHYLILFICLISTLDAESEETSATPTYSPTLDVPTGDDEPHSWPWKVSLQCKDKDRYVHTCGGALINESWVLTAAQCFVRCYKYRAVLGVRVLSKTKVTVTKQIFYLKHSDIFIHEKWNPDHQTYGYDIALIRLPTEVNITSEVNLILLPALEDILPKEYTCYITGWKERRLAIGPLLSDVLQQTRLSVVDHGTCTSEDWWDRNVNLNMICAIGDLKSDCIGDSGGPLSCRRETGDWEVHGIASFYSSRGCFAAKKPIVFTRVSAFIDWIQNIITLNTLE
uniref:Peptidase S1 domain-containing protein n=1 Tax=Leptobrachium leishanense TaxID=445787 RepID=A0A8C5MUT8_9ANUR